MLQSCLGLLGLFDKVIMSDLKCAPIVRQCDFGVKSLILKLVVECVSSFTFLPQP